MPMVQARNIAQHKSLKEDVKRARELRNGASFVEKLLWRTLSVQSRQHGLRFRRQHPIHPFVVDFACLSAKLIIEIDGASHDAAQAYDARREGVLIALGFEVLRFSNQQVCENVEGVALEIIKSAKARKEMLASD